MARTIGLKAETLSAKFTCSKCGKEYKSEDGLKKHIEKEHPE